MYIYAKKAFEFKFAEKRFRTRPLEMVEMPNEFMKDPLFALAVKDGSITVNEQSKKIEKAVLNEPVVLNKYSLEELKAYAAENNIELVQEDNSKTKILAKIKAVQEGKVE